MLIEEKTPVLIETHFRVNTCCWGTPVLIEEVEAPPSTAEPAGDNFKAHKKPPTPLRQP